MERCRHIVLEGEEAEKAYRRLLGSNTYWSCRVTQKIWRKGQPDVKEYIVKNGYIYGGLQTVLFKSLESSNWNDNLIDDEQHVPVVKLTYYLVPEQPVYVALLPDDLNHIIQDYLSRVTHTSSSELDDGDF